MKSKIYSIGLLLNIFLVSNAQYQIKSMILDKETKEPLPYVNIALLGSNYGATTDTTGFFTLNYINKTDSIKVTHIGYTSIFISVKDLQEKSKIFLEPKPFLMQEITVKPDKKRKILEAGYFTPRWAHRIRATPGLQIATLITAKQKFNNAKILKVKFRVIKEGNLNSPLRIRLMEVAKNGKPGEDILTNQLIFNSYNAETEEIITLDVQSYNITFPQEGIFVVIEWIDIVGNKGIPCFTWITVCSRRRGAYFYTNSYDNKYWDKSGLPECPTVGLIIQSSN